jgi:esterase/lipase superfamily enzyme
MGNRALMNAMQILILEQPRLRRRFAQVMLTALDIDAKTFTELAGALKAASNERFGLRPSGKPPKRQWTFKP